MTDEKVRHLVKSFGLQVSSRFALVFSTHTAKRVFGPRIGHHSHNMF